MRHGCVGVRQINKGRETCPVLETHIGGSSLKLIALAIANSIVATSIFFDMMAI
jgi:hypothetical protein